MATPSNTRVFFTVEILYLSVADGSNADEVRRHVVQNITRERLQQTRENIFSGGFAIVIDSDTTEIVSPYRIKRVYVLRQSHFFKNYQAGELTNPNSKLANRK